MGVEKRCRDGRPTDKTQKDKGEETGLALSNQTRVPGPGRRRCRFHRGIKVQLPSGGGRGWQFFIGRPDRIAFREPLARSRRRNN